MAVDVIEAQRLTAVLAGGDSSVQGKLIMMVGQQLRAELARTGPPIRPRDLVIASAQTLLGVQPGSPITGEFLEAAVRAMRGLLYEYAQGRDSNTEVELMDPTGESTMTAPVRVINEVLERLEHVNVRHLRVAEMRYFAALSQEATAKVIGAGISAVKSDWVAVKGFVKREIAARA